MIEKMKHVTLTGAAPELDRIIEQYISRYDIQLDYADGAAALSGTNPYAGIYKKCVEYFGAPENPAGYGRQAYSNEAAVEIAERAVNFFEDRESGLGGLEKELNNITAVAELLSPYRDVDFAFGDLKKFKHIAYRFGKIPVSGFKQFEAFLFDDSDIIFLQGEKSGDYIWCVYFTPRTVAGKSASVLNSLHFSPIDMPCSYGDYIFDKSPREILAYLTELADNVRAAIAKRLNENIEAAGVSRQEIAAALLALGRLYMHHDCRRYAVNVTEDYFSFAGWMAERDAVKLAGETEHDEHVVIIFEDSGAAVSGKPPTKLKNNPLTEPFEFFIRMYGVPNYNELDPTPFVALTYSFFFGMMFGDVGQGAVLSAVGLLLYKLKKLALGKVMAIIGLFSVLFGFLYGSVFGIESALPALLLKPSHSITRILAVAVSFGAAAILTSIIFNMINAAKARDAGRLFFGPNGLAGLIFYSLIVGCAALTFIFGLKISVTAVLLIAAAPLVAITFHGPLSAALTKQKKRQADGRRESAGMFVIEALMELIEALLAYFTNTVSFVRVGGFAISHAGLMGAVMALSGFGSGSPNIAVIVFGNIFVLILEGVIVGIQVLRLEFYEMFSRYYKGDGKEFVSYRSAFEKIK